MTIIKGSSIGRNGFEGPTFIGKATKILTNENPRPFYFKVISCSMSGFEGYNEEGLDLSINFEDIDYMEVTA